MRIVLAVLLAVLVCGGEARAGTTLDAVTQRYLEGRWVVQSQKPAGDPCATPEDEAGDWESYEIDFLRTGGSYYITDLVDAAWRGAISDARKTKSVIALTLDGKFKHVRATPLGRDRMRWNETMGNTPGSGFLAGMAYRCGRAAYDVTRQLGGGALRSLSSRTGGVYFVPIQGRDDPALCKGGYASSTEFDLIGPVYFSVIRNHADAAGTWFGVRKAVGRDARVTLFVKSEDGRPSRLDIVREDEAHIQVAPWGERFRRCAG